jgi:hypothetical protein
MHAWSDAREDLGESGDDHALRSGSGEATFSPTFPSAMLASAVVDIATFLPAIPNTG